MIFDICEIFKIFMFKNSNIGIDTYKYGLIYL